MNHEFWWWDDAISYAQTTAAELDVLGRPARAKVWREQVSHLWCVQLVPVLRSRGLR